jgi:disulfide bond formation protein DsbB
MNFLKKNALYIAWAQALVATVGSLYFSEVAHFTPCVLCWYQRIAMYPQILLLGTGIVRRDKNVVFYAMPLALIGLVISIYHNLLYNKIIPETLAPCAIGASCTTKFIQWFGFITIPFLSMTAFTVIIVCLVFFMRNQKHVNQSESTNE